MTNLRHLAIDTLPSFKNVYIYRERIRILEKIHAGSSGSIYSAEIASNCNQGSNLYAVKCMPKRIGDDDHGVNQSREITLHRLLSDHPNIATMYKLVYDNDFTYLVLEYAKGGDLFDYLLYNPYDDSKIKRIFADMLSAVEACHSRGVYHRDIKPENFLLNDGRCMLTDFSIATLATHSNDYSCSRLQYMSPEAIWTDGKTLADFYVEFSHRANDIWALGICLFNMITGSDAWNYPLMTDANFALFCHYPEAFRERFGISNSGFRFLLAFLTIDPNKRQPLNKLKQDLHQVETFYSSVEAVLQRPTKRRRYSDSSLMSIDSTAPHSSIQEVERSTDISDTDFVKKDWEHSLMYYVSKQDGFTPGWAKFMKPLEYFD